MMFKDKIKAFLSPRVKQLLKRWQSVAKISIWKLFSINGVLSGIYYTFLNPVFKTEFQSCLKAKIKFVNNHESADGRYPQLRRNIHRLEKGLIMRPRKPVFAEAFIIETVRLYGSAVKSSSTQDGELRWANDVLHEYFSVVQDSAITIKARTHFETIISTLTVPPANNKPYKRCENLTSEVTPTQLSGLFQQRRSVRWYREESVPDHLIDQAINMASMAPSACNRQPFEFLVINDRDMAPRVAGIAGGTSGFSGNVPCLMLVVGDLSFYPSEADHNVIYIDGSLAAMQLMLALETLGLSSCPINWPLVRERESRLRKIVKLPTSKKVIMMISVGYAKPDGLIPFSAKKDVSELKTSLECYK